MLVGQNQGELSQSQQWFEWCETNMLMNELGDTSVQRKSRIMVSRQRESGG